jgi:hypothetical protein
VVLSLAIQLLSSLIFTVFCWADAIEKLAPAAGVQTSLRPEPVTIRSVPRHSVLLWQLNGTCARPRTTFSFARLSTRLFGESIHLTPAAFGVPVLGSNVTSSPASSTAVHCEEDTQATAHR